jgi:integrase
MRQDEAKMLRVEDVDLCNGIMNIRHSKGSDQHYIVLYNSMNELLKKYDEAILKQYPLRVYFFPEKGNTFHEK